MGHRRVDAFEVPPDEPHRPPPLMLGASRHPGGGLAHIAIFVLLSGSFGCAGARKAALREDLAAPAGVVANAANETTAVTAVEPKQEGTPEPVSPEHIEAHVRAQVAQRMPAAAPATHRKVAASVLTESSRAGVDPLLVVALIHVESSFNPRARSRAGALGLMQVRVRTLREQLKRPKARRADALDPRTNVQAGVRYLRRLLDTFGATDLALMAYNAGPGRIQRLLAQGGIPERIREYSRKVEDELERIRNALLRPRPTEGSAQSSSLREVIEPQAVAAPRPVR